MDHLVEQQREHFNGISDQYFRARKNPNHLLLKKLIWQYFFKDQKNIVPTVNSVLEPMCGMAEGRRILRDNLNKEFKYLGFDYSENMVEIARASNPTLTIEWNDVIKYENHGDPFDMVILIGGLHHVFSKTSQIIANLGKALRPAGYFISLEPTHDNWLSRSVRKRIYKSNPLFDEDTEEGFEYKNLEQCFSDAGFRKVKQVYPGLLAYVLYYNPDAFPNLNLGGLRLVKMLFAFDRFFWTNFIGRKLSFATLTLWQKIE